MKSSLEQILYMNKIKSPHIYVSIVEQKQANNASMVDVLRDWKTGTSPNLHLK